jgi:hypothetical protein
MDLEKGRELRNNNAQGKDKRRRSRASTRQRMQLRLRKGTHYGEGLRFGS